MSSHLIEREQMIPLPRSQAFAFFSDALNLQLITPPFLHFRVLTQPPIEMRAGALLDYRLSLFGIAFRWQTQIECWIPDEAFVDSQRKGPYQMWHHTHTFEEIAPQQTLMRDRVLYRLPFAGIGELAHPLFVRRTLDKIFDYRAAMTASLLRPDHPHLDELTRAKFQSPAVAAEAPAGSATL